MKKLVFALFAILFSLQFVAPAKDFCFGAPNEDTNFNEFFVGLFGEEISRKAYKNEYVFVSGSPLGFNLQGDGVVVVAVGDVESETGKVMPCDGQDILPGDLLISINDKRITCSLDIERIINETTTDESFELAFIRNKKKSVKHIVPAVDNRNGKKRLGLWIRDSLAGIGTLSFVTENGRFGALGHTVCDSDTGTSLPVSFGNLYACGIVGAVKGQKGAAGELRGVVVKSDKAIGKVSKNNEFGLFGQYLGGHDTLYLEKMSVASREEVHPGKAYILSTIEGCEPKKFSIEIIKVNTQASQKSKSLVFRVIDSELLNKTGGIVQGMSGSPIVQDGKFVGAVTHVFVSDPSKGYGVYAEWMLEQ